MENGKFFVTLHLVLSCCHNVNLELHLLERSEIKFCIKFEAKLFRNIQVGHNRERKSFVSEEISSMVLMKVEETAKTNFNDFHNVRPPETSELSPN